MASLTYVCFGFQSWPWTWSLTVGDKNVAITWTVVFEQKSLYEFSWGFTRDVNETGTFETETEIETKIL